MRIGIIRVDLRIRGSHSLKEKRRSVKAIKDRLRKKYNVSVAEVDYHDLWQRAALGIAFVGNNGHPITRTAQALRREFESEDYAELLDFSFETLSEQP